MTAEVPRRSPLGAWASALPSSPGLTIREVPDRSLFELRLAVGEIDMAEEALGFELPPAGQAAADGKAMWLGPGWWLLDVAADQPVNPRLSTVDVSAGYAVLELTGPHARTVLRHGCSIDLHPRVFGPGSAARTMLAKAQVVLAQTDDAPTYRLWVRTSFARYLAAWLVDAATEYVRGAVV